MGKKYEIGVKDDEITRLGWTPSRGGALSSRPYSGSDGTTGGLAWTLLTPWGSLLGSMERHAMHPTVCSSPTQWTSRERSAPARARPH